MTKDLEYYRQVAMLLASDIDVFYIAADRTDSVEEHMKWWRRLKARRDRILNDTEYREMRANAMQIVSSAVASGSVRTEKL